ncbi:membrane protein insertase YidC [Magnetococcales bacterium HHB-1]
MDRRTLLAISLSFIVLLFYQWYMSTYFPPMPEETQVEAELTNSTPGSTTTVPGDSPGKTVKTLPSDVRLTHTSETGPTATFSNEMLEGKITLKGARLSSIRFFKHRDKQGEEGAPILFLNDTTQNFFFSETGYILPVGVKGPDRESLWKVVTDPTLGENGVQLEWDNQNGLIFKKEIILSPEGYLIHIKDTVKNNSKTPIDIHPYAQFKRIPPPLDTHAMAIADFQGPMAFLEDERFQYEYEELREKDIRQRGRNGWIGFSDKYFLAAIIPDNPKVEKNFYLDYDRQAYRIGEVGAKITIAANEEKSADVRMFIGPKEVRTLEDQGLFLDRAIDYGWFHFLAHPLVITLLFFYDIFGNFGWSIIILTVVIKLLFFPLANKSYRSMGAMKRLQPKVEELKKLYGSDKQRLNQEMMKLYQDNKVNPLGGCLPMLVQIPVFFALYKVLFLSIEMRHSPFIFWINDLSVQDPFYVLPILMGASMFLQNKLNPAPSDPIQAKVMMFLPVLFTVMFLTFPAGLVLYWFVNNVLSIAQQSYIMKHSQ